MSSGTILLIGCIIILAAVAVIAVLMLSRGGSGFKFDIGGQAPRHGRHAESAERTR